MNLLLLCIFLGMALFAWWQWRLISRRNALFVALSELEQAQEHQRATIPEMIQIADQHITHERGLIDEITELWKAAHLTYGSREAADIEEHLQLETRLHARMQRLFTTCRDSLPALLADREFAALQQRYREAGEQTGRARRNYNQAVARLTHAITTVPTQWVARKDLATRYPYFDVTEKVVQQP